MDLAPFVARLRPPGESSDAGDAGIRLALLDLLADAAEELDRRIAPDGVELRLRGRDVDLVVVRDAIPPTAPRSPTDDAGATRTTLRMPEPLRAAAERAAAGEDVSLNTWLVRAIARAVDRMPPTTAGRTDSYVGWVR